MHLNCTTPNDSFVKMKNIINDIITNENTHNCREDNNDKQKIKAQNIGTLRRLPTDLTFKTSLYLDEEDIFEFEKCCKLFYQIVNNSLYLNECNTFKTFNLTQKTLDQMTRPQNSFYKYSKAAELSIKSFTASCGQQVETQFDKAMTISGHDKWLETMFKSIKVLKINTNGFVLLPKLPIDILFNPDPIKSNLERFYVQSHNHAQQFVTNIDQFHKKYIILKRKFENEGKKIKILQGLDQSIFDLEGNTISQLLAIESKHTCVDAFEQLKQLLEHNFQFCHENNNSSLETLTFRYCQFDSIDTSKINSNTINCNERLQSQIKTLRLMNLSSHSNTDILENKKLIESLNFHNSVKNMTLSCVFNRRIDCDNWTKIISHLLTKTYYFNLNNLNIVLHFYSTLSNEDMVNWIFTILQENQQLLKHQFSQLNIAFDILGPGANLFSDERFCTLKWNSKIDDEFLSHFQEQCNQSCEQISREGEANTHKEKYLSVMGQWVE